MRELCSRAGDGIEVALLWRPAADELCVAVVDTKLNQAFHIPVDAADAMWAPHRDLVYDRRGFVCVRCGAARSSERMRSGHHRLRLRARC